MMKPQHQKVCNPRYNEGTRGQALRLTSSVLTFSFSPEKPQRRRECGAMVQFEQSQLKPGKKRNLDF